MAAEPFGDSRSQSCPSPLLEVKCVEPSPCCHPPSGIQRVILKISCARNLVPSQRKCSVLLLRHFDCSGLECFAHCGYNGTCPLQSKWAAAGRQHGPFPAFLGFRQSSKLDPSRQSNPQWSWLRSAPHGNLIEKWADF